MEQMEQWQAQFELAMKYIYGDGVEEDNVKAAALLEEAAQQGHVEAAYNLGVCYHYGHGVEQDLRTAYQLYLRSALQGYGKGFNMVGDFYAQGICVRQSHREAIKWYLDGASSQDPAAVSYAEYKLADCLAYGLGVEQDPDAAVEWYEKALAHGEIRAKEALEKLGYYASFRIRPARQEDAAAVAEISASALGYVFGREETEKALTAALARSDDRVFVAIASDMVVGFVHGQDYETLYAPSYKNIMGIAVAAEHRRKGIGRALLGKIEQWAAETGAAGVRLVSGMEREEAHRFYDACGYAEQKRQLNFRKEI